MKIKLTNPLKWQLKFKLIGLAVIVLLAGGIWFWRSRTKNPSQELQTARVQKGNLTNSLALSGQVEQSNLISVSSKASGVVNQVYVTDGQEVKKGQKIAEITLDSEGINNQSSAWSSYLSAQTSLESAKTQLWTLESTMWQKHEDFESRALDNELSVDDPVFIETQRDWLAAEANYKNQAQVVTQRQAALSSSWYNYQLYQATITAPVNGTIVGLNLAEGLTISYSEGSSGTATSQIAAIIKTAGRPIASFNVTEVDIPKLTVGQKATIIIDSYPDETFSGTVEAINRVGQTSSGVTQYPVLISFDEDDPRILTNMGITAEIILEQKEDVLYVPSEAIISAPNSKKIVRKMIDGRPQPTAVETGMTTDTYTEIVSGLDQTDEVVASSSFTGSPSSQSNFSGNGGFPGGGFGSFSGGARPDH
jgi:multidrug efflux pump subunit AcrA (membrane-fusion protein)